MRCRLRTRRCSWSAPDPRASASLGGSRSHPPVASPRARRASKSRRRPTTRPSRTRCLRTPLCPRMALPSGSARSRRNPLPADPRPRRALRLLARLVVLGLWLRLGHALRRARMPPPSCASSMSMLSFGCSHPERRASSRAARASFAGRVPARIGLSYALQPCHLAARPQVGHRLAPVVLMRR